MADQGSPQDVIYLLEDDKSAIHTGSFLPDGKHVLLRAQDFEQALEVIHLKQQYLEDARKEDPNKAPE